MSTFTITFGDAAENHVGMQKISAGGRKGFSSSDLQKISMIAEGGSYALHDLSDDLPEELLQEYEDPDAYLLVIKGGITSLLSSSDDLPEFYEDIKRCKLDRKAWMRGRVVEKRARWNVCFGEDRQDPDYENKKGRIIAFKDVHYLETIRKNLGKLGKKCRNLVAELNFYYDTEKCGIGYHGDTERKIVIGMRLGDDLPLCFMWHHQGKASRLHQGDHPAAWGYLLHVQESYRK